MGYVWIPVEAFDRMLTEPWDAVEAPVRMPDLDNVISTDEVCHLAPMCFGDALEAGEMAPMASVCGVEMAGTWCHGSRCVECDTEREACGVCGRLVCESCRARIAEL